MAKLDHEKEKLLLSIIPNGLELLKTDEGIDEILDILDRAMLDALSPDFEPTNKSGAICQLYDTLVCM